MASLYETWMKQLKAAPKPAEAPAEIPAEAPAETPAEAPVTNSGRWKPIEETGGLYEVSRDGKVCIAKTKELVSIYSAEYMGSGRPYVWIKVDGQPKLRYISRLVAHAFVENPLGLKYVSNKDGDIMNCSADNLEWTGKKGNAGVARKKRIRCRCIETGRICDTISEMAQALSVSESTISIAIKYHRKVNKKYTIVPE